MKKKSYYLLSVEFCFTLLVFLLFYPTVTDKVLDASLLTQIILIAGAVSFASAMYADKYIFK